MSALDELKKKVTARLDAKMASLARSRDVAEQQGDLAAAERLSFALHEVAAVAMTIGADLFDATKPD